MKNGRILRVNYCRFVFTFKRKCDIISASGVFLMPLYYVFSPQKLTVVWLLPFKKTIPWGAVNGIIEYKPFETVKDLPKYEIVYCQNYKGETVIKQIDLPRNRKTKPIVEKYAKHKLVRF